MADPRFDIHYAGQLVAGADPATVRANVAKLFKTEVARIEHLFSGQRIAIKKGVDEATATAYRNALAKAGAIAEIVPGGEPASAADSALRTVPARQRPDESPPPPLPAPSAAAGETGALAGEQPERTSTAGGAVPPLRVFTTPPVAPDFGVAEPGAILVEPTVVTAPQIDTSHLSVAAVGTVLSDTTPVPEPQFDLSAFKLDPPGTLLGDPTPVPPANIDTSALKLAD